MPKFVEVTTAFTPEQVRAAINERTTSVLRKGATIPCSQEMLVDLCTVAVTNTMRYVGEQVDQAAELSGTADEGGTAVFGMVTISMVGQLIEALGDVMAEEAGRRIMEKIARG